MSETVFPPPPPPSIKPEGFNLENNISPSILLIIIILAIIFFVSSLLHLLIRFLMKPPRTHQEDYDNVTALQGQLQQLFHLHDSGVDQSFIDTLPVFYYKAIIGSKNPFDCAVCLCEFEGEHKLRLLPKCSHAFHMECIDTWLLSHSTCPLCRASLLPDFSPNNGFSPVVLVLESGDESSREIRLEPEVSVGRTSSRLGFNADFEMGSSRFDLGKKSVEMVKEEDTEEKIVSVKLGKCKNGGGGGEGSSGSKMVDSRRCFSMGSFEYVMEENLCLRVPIKPPSKNQQSKKTPLPPLKPGYKSAMSECDCESRREFKFSAFESAKTIGDERQETSSNQNVIFKERESFSVSKIWLHEKKGVDSSRRAFSFRFPVHRTGGTIAGDDEENQSCNSLDSMANPPSFARKTLLWLMGRQNKVVHSSFPPKI